MGRSRTTPPVTETVIDLSTVPRHGPSAQDASVREVGEASDVRTLPATTARELGLEPDATYARAARLLLGARHAPGGPGCRSFWACFFLAAADTLPETPGAEASRPGRCSTTDPDT